MSAYLGGKVTVAKAEEGKAQTVAKTTRRVTGARWAVRSSASRRRSNVDYYRSSSF